MDSLTHNSIIKVIVELNTLENICIEAFTVDRTIGKTLREFENDGIKITKEIKQDALMNERYFPHKAPFFSENSQSARRRIWQLQDNLVSQGKKVIEAFKVYIETHTINQLS